MFAPTLEKLPSGTWLPEISAPAPACVILLCVAACGAAPELPADPLQPNVVIVTLDTTRPDHLGCYGYDRNTSPRLDELCRDAQVHTKAYSTSSWTLPAHASLFTGLLTATHGATYDPAGPLLLSAVLDEPASRQHRVFGLGPDTPTLASLLARRGYQTAGVVGGPWLKGVFGLGAGFEHWDDDGIDALNGRRAAAVSDAAIAWLSALDSQYPFLLFLNYYDPHSPYDPPEEWRSTFLPTRADGSGGAPPSGAAQTLEQARALYDAEILYTDQQLGRVLDLLRAGGAYDASWVIVTSDHGELLGEHGVSGHGRFLFQEELLIPLVVKAPGTRRKAGRSQSPISLTGVLPMLARELELPLPSAAAVTRDRLVGRGGSQIVAELDPGPRFAGRGSWKAIVDGPFKLVWNSRGKHRLYDLRSRSGEDVNRIGDLPERAAHLQRRLESILAAVPAAARVDVGPEHSVDAETRRALEGLGYLERAE